MSVEGEKGTRSPSPGSTKRKLRQEMRPVALVTNGAERCASKLGATELSTDQLPWPLPRQPKNSNMPHCSHCQNSPGSKAGQKKCSGESPIPRKRGGQGSCRHPSVESVRSPPRSLSPSRSGVPRRSASGLAADLLGRSASATGSLRPQNSASRAIRRCRLPRLDAGRCKSPRAKSPMHEPSQWRDRSLPSLDAPRARPSSLSPMRRPLGHGLEQEPAISSYVSVFLRVRPPSARESLDSRCIQVDNKSVRVHEPGGKREHCFTFEDVIDSSSGAPDQERVFEAIGKQAVQSVLDGFHTCIFALGQTGTGKTYTLIGTPEEPGLLPQVLRWLLQAQHGDHQQRLRLSCLELHIDRLYDLLAEDGTPAGERHALDIRCHPHRGVYVSKLSEVLIEDSDTAFRLVDVALRRRSISRTSMNSLSSRGHTVFQITTESGARLCIVDLAGRENERTTRCHGQLLAELGYINKSLFHLTTVIQALARPSPGTRVPFRNSKLTLLLSDCLQSARTFLLATVSPATSSFEETMTTLRLAQSVRQITTKSHCHRTQIEPEIKPECEGHRSPSRGVAVSASPDRNCDHGHRSPCDGASRSTSPVRHCEHVPGLKPFRLEAWASLNFEADSANSVAAAPVAATSRQYQAALECEDLEDSSTWSIDAPSGSWLPNPRPLRLEAWKAPSLSTSPGSTTAADSRAPTENEDSDRSVEGPRSPRFDLES